jgi:integrase
MFIINSLKTLYREFKRSAPTRRQQSKLLHEVRHVLRLPHYSIHPERFHRVAVRRTGLIKQISAHTFRHSFVTTCFPIFLSTLKFCGPLFEKCGDSLFVILRLVEVL